MRTPKGIFFADGIRFKDIAFDDPDAVANAVKVRFATWYTEPIKILIDNGKIFSAGLICISFIDALSEYTTQSDKHERFIAWSEANLPDFSQADPLIPGKTLAFSFYNFFRNGLVHHTRVNCGGQISLEIDSSFAVINGTYVLNPEILLYLLEKRLADFIQKIRNDRRQYDIVKDFLQRNFKKDIQNDIAWK